MHQSGFCLLVLRSYSFQSIRWWVFSAVVDNVVHGSFFCTTGACHGIAKITARHIVSTMHLLIMPLQRRCKMAHAFLGKSNPAGAEVFCNYTLFAELPWPGDSEETFRSSSQAATTCLPHTVEASHCLFNY